MEKKKEDYNVWHSGMYHEDLKIKSTNKKRRKFVDYYNQMREERFGEKGYFKYTMGFDEVHIISKHMWFIEWLVDNDKIDRENWDILDECMGWFDRYPIDLNTHTLNNDATDMLIMILSIQDNPISFILSILK